MKKIFLFLGIFLIISRLNLFSGFIPVSNNILNINLQCRDCSGIIYLMNLNSDLPVWRSITKKVDFSGSGNISIKNIPKGDYVLAVRDDLTKDVGWLLNDNNIAFCPFPLSLKKISIVENSTSSVNIDLSNKVECCYRNYKTKNDSNFVVHLNNIENENITGKLIIIPLSVTDISYPIEIKIDSKDISEYLPEGKYYIWAYVKDGSVYKTSDNWEKIDVSNGENSFQLNMINSHSLKLDFQNKNFKLKKRLIFIFKKDLDENWRLFYYQKCFIGDGDSVTIKNLPPGSYKIAYANSLWIGKIDLNSNALIFYKDDGETFSINDADLIQLDDDTTIEWVFPESYSISGSVYSPDKSVLSDVIIVADLYYQNKIVDTKIVKPNIFGKYGISGIYNNETVEIKFFKSNFYKKVTVPVKNNLTLNTTLSSYNDYISANILIKSSSLINSRLDFYNSSSGTLIGYTWTDGNGNFKYYVPDDISGVKVGLLFNGNYYFIGNDSLVADYDNGTIFSTNRNNEIEIDKDYEITEDCLNGNIMVSEKQYDYGNIPVGTTSYLNLTLTNFTGESINIDKASFIQNASNAFSIDNDSCSGNSISSLNSCNIKIAFTPVDFKSYNSFFEISIKNSGVKLITLKGKGVEFDPQDEVDNITSSFKEIQDNLSLVDQGKATEAQIKALTLTVNGLIDRFLNVVRGVKILISAGKKVDTTTLLKIINLYKQAAISVRILKKVNANINLTKFSNLLDFINSISQDIIKTEDTNSINTLIETAKSLVDELKNISEKTTNPDEINSIVTNLDKTINSGLSAAIKNKVGAEEISSLLGKSKEVIGASIDRAKKVATPEQLSKIIKNSGRSVGRIFNNIVQLKKELTPQTKETIIKQSKTITQNLTERVINTIKSLPKEKVNVDDALQIKEGESEVASNFLKIKDSGLDNDDVNLFQQLSQNLIDKISDDLNLSSNSFASQNDNNSKLIKLFKVATIDITEGIVSKPSPDQLGLDNQTANTIISVLPDVAAPNRTIYSQDNSTINNENIIKSLFTNTTIESDTIQSISKIKVNGFEIPSYFSSTSIVSSKLNGKILLSPKGNFILIDNSVGSEISPAPEDAISFIYYLTKNLSLDNNSLNFNPDGTFSVNLDNLTFVGSFSYLTSRDNSSFSVGTVSFSISGTDPASASFQILVKYENGVTQGITPYIHEIDLFDQLLDKYSLSYSVDRNTGIVTIEANGQQLKYKPDYNFIPLTTDEKDWLKSNQIINGFGFKLEDKNNDGKLDIILYSSNGSQILYGL